MNAWLAALRSRALPGLVAALLWAGPVPPACAQGDEVYLVEVIVFARPALRTSYYRWPGEPDVSGAIDLAPGLDAPDAPAQPVFGDGASRRFRTRDADFPSPLSPAHQPFAAVDAAALVEDWRRLAESRDFEPLVHLAWRQPAATFGEPQPVRVHGGGTVARRPDDAANLLFDPDPAARAVAVIDGTVALERGRFLHLRVDLALRVPAREGHGHPLDPITQEHAGSYFTFRLSERRQIQTGVVSYFDHQRFGLIALVQQWVPEDGALTTGR